MRSLEITIAESYREDHIAFRKGSRLPFLLVSECLAKVHALLAHAYVVSMQIPAVNQIVVRMDWRGLHDRTLCWDAETVVFGGKKVAEDRFFRTITVAWPCFAPRYSAALCNVRFPRSS
jgi:hypothetical protein